MLGFVDSLPISDGEKAKLNDLAAESPAALFAMIQANPQAFEKHMGSDRAREIKDVLRNLISKKDYQVLAEPQTNFHKLGAIVGERSPKLKTPGYDIEERNRLFNELQYLESSEPSSEKVKQRILTLTQQLDELMNKTG